MSTIMPYRSQEMETQVIHVYSSDALSRWVQAIRVIIRVARRLEESSSEDSNITKESDREKGHRDSQT